MICELDTVETSKTQANTRSRKTLFHSFSSLLGNLTRANRLEYLAVKSTLLVLLRIVSWVLLAARTNAIDQEYRIRPWKIFTWKIIRSVGAIHIRFVCATNFNYTTLWLRLKWRTWATKTPRWRATSLVWVCVENFKANQIKNIVQIVQSEKKKFRPRKSCYLRPRGRALQWNSIFNMIHCTRMTTTTYQPSFEQHCIFFQYFSLVRCTIGWPMVYAGCVQPSPFFP